MFYYSQKCHRTRIIFLVQRVPRKFENVLRKLTKLNLFSLCHENVFRFHVSVVVKPLGTSGLVEFN
jgi:hypothetical protein